MPRILAFDYGTKRIGIAVTDPLQIIATGLDTVHPKDIIEYLPVEHFVGGARSWDQLRAEYDAKGVFERGSRIDFKAWLRRAYRARFSSARIREAAHGMEPPEDFQWLMRELEVLASSNQ